MRGVKRIDASTAFFTKLTELIVADVAVLILVQCLEHGNDLLGRKLKAQVLEAYHEVVEGNLLWESKPSEESVCKIHLFKLLVNLRLQLVKQFVDLRLHDVSLIFAHIQRRLRVRSLCSCHNLVHVERNVRVFLYLYWPEVTKVNEVLYHLSREHF